MAQGSEPDPGVTVITDPARPGRAWVRLDEHGISYRNSGRTEQIGWAVLFERRQVSQAARRAQFASAQRNPPAPVEERDDNAPTAITSQSPAAGPAAAAVRVSCAECGAGSTQATGVCARCGVPLVPLTSP